MLIATLIAAKRLGDAYAEEAARLLRDSGAKAVSITETAPGTAVDIAFDGDLDAARQALAPLTAMLDVIVQPLAHRARKLLVSDMDSTMIQAECIDELADYAGLRAEIAEVTERAMRGELDFEAALRSRVALLKGLEASAIAACLAERVKPMPGARTLVRTLASRGVETVLVSGGFHHFADPVAEDLGFVRVAANRLEIADGRLTGGLVGPIMDAAGKAVVLAERAAALGIAPHETLALGDGANDIPMIRAAGLGLAYHAKPAARAAADGAIDHGDLTAALYALGIPRDAWDEG